MRHVHAVGITAMFAVLVACGSSLRNESAYAAQLPAGIRPSYDVFAQRCSKCHTLSRPLDSGIDDDAYWAIYVRRMRLQPGSGISEADEKTILEFLRYYARTRREERAAPSAAPNDAAGAPSAAPNDAGGASSAVPDDAGGASSAAPAAREEAADASPGGTP